MGSRFSASMEMPDLKGMTALLENEKLHREGLIITAAEPTAAEMKRVLEPHRRANPSAVDSIGIANAPTKIGLIQVVVGAMGFRDYVLWFLNYGTRKQQARPWLEPSRDKIAPGVGERLAAFLRGKGGQ